MCNRKRPIKLSLYVNEEELKVLDAKTELARAKNRNNFIRKLILNGEVRYEDFHEFREYNWKLSNLTNNLNQIAHIANSNGKVDDENLKKAKEYLEEVWQLQKSILSNLPYKNQ